MRRDRTCHHCQQPWSILGENDFMLRQDLWEQLAPKEAVVCRPCVEKALGRPLAARDLIMCLCLVNLKIKRPSYDDGVAFLQRINFDLPTAELRKYVAKQYKRAGINE